MVHDAEEDENEEDWDSAHRTGDRSFHYMVLGRLYPLNSFSIHVCA